MALVSTDVFAAGISMFGIGDLALLASDTHKFESEYLDGLMGRAPDMAERYRERSPIHHLDRISCPVLILHGLDDQVVPPSQAEALVAALAKKAIPHAYLAFEGEGHGFEGATAVIRAAEARLSFLGAVLGFTPADDLPPLELPGLAAWQDARRRTVTAC
jgi:dipeptidyl aminopeptidase/acylaminoacyl peptidase